MSSFDLQCEPKIGDTEGPAFRTATVLKEVDGRPVDIEVVHAEGLQVAVESINDERPLLAIVQHYGEGGLYTAYADPKLISDLIRGLEQARDALISEQERWDRKHA